MNETKRPPDQFVAMSASIFMTVGIALERYIAVHYPIGKDHACVELKVDPILLLAAVSSAWNIT